MSSDDLVEVPENAVIEERIALGLTAPQLGIVVAAVLLAAALNLLPVWAPLRVLLILLLAGPLALAAVLPVRGEPAYRWIVRAVRYWRSPKVWRAELRQVSKRPVSGDVEDGANETEPAAVGSVLGRTTLTASESGAVDSGTDNGAAATRSLAAPSPLPVPAVTESPVLEEQGRMDGSPARLRVVRRGSSGSEPGTAGPGEEAERPPSIPYVLPSPRVACFTSFVGGVGKTTLAVETAALIAAHARYRTADGSERAVRVLLFDASRLSSAAGLRLGIHPEQLSDAWSRRDWRRPEVVAEARAQTAAGVDVVTLPPHPQLAGHERHLADGISDDFEPLDADAVRNGAHDTGYQLVIADLGSVLEAGHRRLLDLADVVVGVVRPTLESLPDVLRLTGFLRAVDQGRKLVLVANACDDDTELRTLAREAGIPLVAAIPPSAAFGTAADRHQPAWRADPSLRAALLPVARCIWPLDTLEAPARRGRLAGMVQRAVSLAARRTP